KNQNRNGWLRLTALIILGLIVLLGLLLSVFGYIQYSKFKNNCINQISKQHSINTIIINFKAGTTNEELNKIDALKYRLSSLEDILSINYVSPTDNAQRFYEKYGKQMEGIGISAKEIKDSASSYAHIDIKVGVEKTEKYFQDAINKELTELQLENNIDAINIFIINKQDYLKAVNFLSFLKLKLSPRTQSIKEFYEVSSDCDLL
ncbi:MAG: hypothetical protein PHE24_07045, partial [Patescibacteria group bacterium]|nr:hypothetical protein [Patescibacteria group bacterium]